MYAFKFLRILTDDLKTEQINIFFVLSTFLVTISYLCVKAFFGSGELSDNIFTISIPFISEISFMLILLVNKTYLKNNSDFFIFGLSFFCIFLLWDYDSYTSSKLFYFIIYILITIIFLSITNKILTNKSYSKNNFFTLTIFLFFLNGIFFKIDYLNYKNLLIVFSIYIFYLISIISLKKLGKFFNIIFSIFIFFVFLKVFILSSDKDSFHYSYVLGSSYSYFAGSELLSEVSSQYGYLNVLFVKLFSIFTNNRMDYSLILIIIFLLILFFSLFIKIIKKITKLPFPIVVFFAAALIFANNGIENLSGSILIPSSSVFRFLPALITMLFISKFFTSKKNNHLKKNIYFFYFFLTIGILWSFESFFFIVFSLLSLLFFVIFFNIVSENKSKNFYNFYINYKFYIYQNIFLSIIFLLIIFFVFRNNQFSYFYEYVINQNSVKGLDILNSRYTLIFISFLLINYLFLRSTLKFDNNYFFYNNLIWFSLFISFSAYFVVRSIHNNLFSLLPFYIYFTASMRSESKFLQNIKKLFIEVFILVSIVAMTLSIYSNKDIFYERLTSLTVLQLPYYKYNNYKPSIELQSILNSYKNSPLTLVTGKTIHNYNNNLSHGGYGLPILPLEQFNMLTKDRKTNLMNSFFQKNKKHLILCLNECFFYNENTKMRNWESIFLPLEFNVKKIFFNYETSETLYLIKK